MEMRSQNGEAQLKLTPQISVVLATAGPQELGFDSWNSATSLAKAAEIAVRRSAAGWDLTLHKVGSEIPESFDAVTSRVRDSLQRRADLAIVVLPHGCADCARVIGWAAEFRVRSLILAGENLENPLCTPARAERDITLMRFAAQHDAMQRLQGWVASELPSLSRAPARPIARRIASLEERERLEREWNAFTDDEQARIARVLDMPVGSLAHLLGHGSVFGATPDGFRTRFKAAIETSRRAEAPAPIALLPDPDSLPTAFSKSFERFVRERRLEASMASRLQLEGLRYEANRARRLEAEPAAKFRLRPLSSLAAWATIYERLCEREAS